MAAPFVTTGGYTLPIETLLLLANTPGGDPFVATELTPFPASDTTSGTGSLLRPPSVTTGGYTFPIDARLIVFNAPSGDPVAVSALNPFPCLATSS